MLKEKGIECYNCARLHSPSGFAACAASKLGVEAPPLRPGTRQLLRNFYTGGGISLEQAAQQQLRGAASGESLTHLGARCFRHPRVVL